MLFNPQGLSTGTALEILLVADCAYRKQNVHIVLRSRFKGRRRNLLVEHASSFLDIDKTVV